jgi:hypothetical protein
MPLDAAKLPSSARALLLALPDNPAADRARFREELAGGMYSLPKRRQFVVALSFLAGVRRTPASVVPRRRSGIPGAAKRLAVSASDAPHGSHS